MINALFERSLQDKLMVLEHRKAFTVGAKIAQLWAQNQINEEEVLAQTRHMLNWWRSRRTPQTVV